MKHWKTVLKIMLTAALVGWLVMGVEWPAVIGILAGIKWQFIVLYVLLQLIGNLVSTLKWQFLARSGGFSFGTIAGFFAYLSGAFINNFLPSTVGGDAYRTVWMSRTGNRSEAVLIVLYDRLTGLATLSILSLGFFFILPFETLLMKPWLIVLGGSLFSLACIVVLGVFLAPRLLGLILLLLRLIGGVRISAFLSRLAPFTGRRIYLRSLLWSSLFFLIGIGLSNFALFQALGAELTLVPFLGTIFLATLVANIPISINNIGVKEWSYAFFFGFLGIPLELAVTAALLSRVLQMGISFLALPWYLHARKLDLIYPAAQTQKMGL